MPASAPGLLAVAGLEMATMLVGCTVFWGVINLTSSTAIATRGLYAALAVRLRATGGDAKEVASDASGCLRAVAPAPS